MDLALLGLELDSGTQRVFSNLNDSMATDWANCLTPLLHYFSKSSFRAHTPFWRGSFPWWGTPLEWQLIMLFSQPACHVRLTLLCEAQLQSPKAHWGVLHFGIWPCLSSGSQDSVTASMPPKQTKSPSTGTDPSKQCSSWNGLGMDLARPVRIVPDSFSTQAGHYQDLLVDLMRLSNMVREEDQTNCKLSHALQLYFYA